MQNEVWSEIGTFLNGLRCGNVKRESYIQIPEVAEAEEKKLEAGVRHNELISAVVVYM